MTFKVPTRVWLSSLILGLAVCALGWGARLWTETADLSGGFQGSKALLKDAPEISLPDDQGRRHSLSELRGKLVILHFWATWCAPCIEEIPQWVELARKMEGQPIAWIAVSLDHSWSEAHRYLKPERLPPNLISLLDAQNETPGVYGSYQFPETYLIAPDGKILSKWVGPQAWDSDSLKRAIERVVELTIHARTR